MKRDPATKKDINNCARGLKGRYRVWCFLMDEYKGDRKSEGLKQNDNLESVLEDVFRKFLGDR